MDPMKIHPPHPARASFIASARPRFARGFTLVELMIVVAIVAILAAIAYPSFTAQVRKSRRSDAVEAITAVQQAQERWRANSPSYSTSLASLQRTANSANGYYTISIASVSNRGYTVFAEAVAGKSQAQDRGCTLLSVQVASVITQSPANCWSQ